MVTLPTDGESILRLRRQRATVDGRVLQSVRLLLASTKTLQNGADRSLQLPRGLINVFKDEDVALSVAKRKELETKIQLKCLSNQQQINADDEPIN